jgi:cysteine-rich repeat protein
MRKVLAISLIVNVLFIAERLIVEADAGADGHGGGVPCAGNGDVNCDGTINLSDPVALLNWLFTGGVAPCPCRGTTAVCGNNTVEDGEECDDGNTTPGDGCDSSCDLEPFCGNGVEDADEQCDDGNTLPGDGCAPDCTLEAVTCGDGIKSEGEECDDGNTTPGDGCDAFCRIETNTCGNGSIDGAEECDGVDLNGRDCTSFGFSGGTLGCGPGCTYDTSGCVQ